MKIDLRPEQEAYLSTKDTICQVIRENPDSVFAFDILQDEIQNKTNRKISIPFSSLRSIGVHLIGIGACLTHSKRAKTG